MQFGSLVAVGMIASVVACSDDASRSAPPPPSACGFVRVDKTVEVTSMHHRAADVIGSLQLSASAQVLRTEGVQATLPATTKVRLPPGRRPLWLIYTLEANITTTGAVNLSTTSAAELLHIVDDATLRSVATISCPSG